MRHASSSGISPRHIPPASAFLGTGEFLRLRKHVGHIRTPSAPAPSSWSNNPSMRTRAGCGSLGTRRCRFGMELISTALGNNSVRKKTFAQTAQVDLESAWLLVESMYRPRHDWISASEGRSRKLWWMEVPSNSSYCAFWCCRVLSWATGVVRSWSRNTMPRSHAMSLIWKDFEQHKLGPFYTSVIQFWGSS